MSWFYRYSVHGGGAAEITYPDKMTEQELDEFALFAESSVRCRRAGIRCDKKAREQSFYQRLADGLFLQAQGGTQ